ncbi:MAG: Rrf2 family transcriptional regulator [Gammaproteobacteria bacterium]|nr:Rrf2 family transcriptional regulator [Gammaproteobacteria bacterium]MCP5202131.1 Rrf2 family transcriptional regulator [Gammaproteobacteria bacterium]
MAHLTGSVEYALHCLLWLVDAGTPASSRDLAELQGISPSLLAKILPRLEKAGLVESIGGVSGGYRLARPATAISFLDVVDAIEGDKPLFDCQEIRTRCAVFGERAPAWATRGVCGIHAVMLEAEQAMRGALAARSLADVHAAVARKAPAAFEAEVRGWLERRHAARGAGRRRTRGAPDRIP